MIVAKGVLDGVNVGKAVGVLVGTDVNVGDQKVVGNCVTVFWILFGLALEEHPTIAMKINKSRNSLSFI